MKQALYRKYLEREGIPVDGEYRIHFTSDHMGAMLWWAGARIGECYYPDLEEFMDFIIDEMQEMLY